MGGDEPHFDEPATMNDLRASFARQYAPPDALPAWLPIVKMIRRLRDHQARTRALVALAGRDAGAWAARGDADAEVILRMYVDLHHYAPEVCRMIAERIADAIVVPD